MNLLIVLLLLPHRVNLPHFPFSTGTSDISFYPILSKRFDHLEILLTIYRHKKVLSAGSLCRPLVPSPQSKRLKRTFMLPQVLPQVLPFMLPQVSCFSFKYAIKATEMFDVKRKLTFLQLKFQGPSMAQTPCKLLGQGLYFTLYVS